MADTQLTKMNHVFVPMIERQLEGNAIVMTPYQKVCVLGALQKINELATEKGLDINNIKNNISSILLTVASLELNANAEPREIYFIVRNHNTGAKDDKGYTIKRKEIEMGIEGDGNDALLRRFGRDVVYIHKFWEVKEGDTFTLPKHVGTEVEPPKWEESGNSNGKTMYVVYPIDFDAGKDRIDTQYFVTSRDQVKRNLMAHCVNNLMWDGDKSKKINRLKELFNEHTLDELLDDDEVVKLGQISPAWREPQSRETMIVRKMRNNIVKKIPKQFSNGLMATQFAENSDDHASDMRKDVTENANQEVIEPEFESVEQPKPSTTNDSYQEAPSSSSTGNESIPDSPNTEAAAKEGEPF